MNSLRLIITGSALICSIVFGAQELSTRPNILFILADDQRYDELGCAGEPFLKTPTLDRLAGQGVRFRNMFAATPICMVSRATIFTGLYERTHRYMPGNPNSKPVNPSDEAACFPNLLRQAGYRTGYYGKNHVSFENGTRQAFDRMFDDWEHIHRAPYFKKMPDGSERHCDEIMGDRSVKFLESQPADQPFFLYMSFNTAHAEDRDHRPGIGQFPWPHEVDGLYEDITPPRPRLDDPAIFDALPDFLKTSMNRKRYGWRWDTPEKYTVNMRARYRMITGLDRIIERVLETLEARGLAENTIVIYTADNGYFRGERGLAGKWSHLEESLRVPLIVYDPRRPQPQRGVELDPLVLNLDLPSVFLDLAGIPVPQAYQGRSILPWLAGEMPVDWRQSYFCEHHQLGGSIPSWFGIRENRYVYACYDLQDPPYEFLHDLQRDPDELQNFVADPEYAPILKKLRAQAKQSVKTLSRQKEVPIDVPAVEAVLTGPVKVFNGDRFESLPDIPVLRPDRDFSWLLRVKILPGNGPGAVLMGNRVGVPELNFLKMTAERGVQLFVAGQRCFTLKTPPLPKGQWVNLALIKKAKSFTLFVDGHEVAQASVGKTIPSMPCFIGGDPKRKSEMATCEISYAGIFPRALEQAELIEKVKAAHE